MKISNREFEDLGVCAVRYCLGRQTYMPFAIIKILEKHISQINNTALHTMNRDISECRDLGADIDQKSWHSFQKAINQELKKREEERLKEESEDDN